MTFGLRWTPEAREAYEAIRAAAQRAMSNRERTQRHKSSRQEGLFKQLHKCLKLLSENPRHPGLAAHEFKSLTNPFEEKAKVFEAYAQQNTPAAYRVFWCYGPGKGEVTIIAITDHP